MPLKRISIVGQKFRGLPEYLPGYAAGSLAFLVREPDNRFDSNAVQVWIDGKHVGYLPKTQNTPLAAFLDTLEPASKPPMALDEKLDAEARGKLSGRKIAPVKFVRSPNSGFPQIEYDDEALHG